MEIVGRVTLAHLKEMERRGLSPKEAVDRLLSNAKERTGKTVVLHRDGDGFDLIAVGPA